ncbi:MAG: hypothetical protein NZM12_11900 [Steroidobacteraceae bacterium]|nr:hypothetical protein [Steroidobacteraceae bacterium]MDW8257834.1 hypothetical protein [Gammaproteobacteria bacterium]
MASVMPEILSALREGPPNGRQWGTHEGRQLAELLADSPWTASLLGRSGPGQDRAVSALASAIDAWMQSHSETLRAVKARNDYLAQQVESANRYGSHARVLSLWSSLGQLRREYRVIHPPLRSILSSEYAVFDCGLICIPQLPGNLDSSTTTLLLARLATWIRAEGEVVVASFTDLPEASFLREVLGCCPAVSSPEKLLYWVRDLEDVVANVYCLRAEGLAFLHLQRV